MLGLGTNRHEQTSDNGTSATKSEEKGIQCHPRWNSTHQKPATQNGDYGKLSGEHDKTKTDEGKLSQVCEETKQAGKTEGGAE